MEDILILSGHGLYDLDYRRVLAEHRAQGADVTIISHAVSEAKASRSGLLRVDPETRVVQEFAEKPSAAELEGGAWKDAASSQQAPYEASMGIYCFKREALLTLLTSETKGTTSAVHFGPDVIPHALKEGFKVIAYHHEGFWKDITTLRAFYDINLELTKPNPPLSVSAIHRGIISRGYHNPPAIITRCEIENTLVGDGCQLRGSTITNAVMGRNCFIDEGCTIQDSVIIGNSLYQNDAERERLRMAGEQILGIGKNVILKNAVLDSNVCIGNDVSITNMYGILEADRADTGGFMIQDGIVVILDNKVILDGTRI